MDEKQEKINLRLAEDGMTVLLDCDIAVDDLDSLVTNISNELGPLGIKEIPDKEQLKEKLSHAAEENPKLVDFILIEGGPEKPNLRVSEDGMEVLLDCDVTVDDLDSLVADISEKLKSLNIKGPPDKKQLKDKIRKAGKEGPSLVDFVLIEGVPPTQSQDGKVEWVGDFFNTGFLIDKKTGKVNYREKAAHKAVKKDDLLGKQILAKKGKDGKDVFGKVVPAREPKEYYPGTGSSVRFKEAEHAYYAAANGRVRFADNVLSVNEVYSIPENVDIKTGNISHTGSVVINGDILRDSKVEADGDIEVKGVIEGAEVKTGGDLTVNGGMRLEDQKIVVEGSLNARFIDGGIIETKKDVVVRNEIVNSTIRTLGAVIIPRGHIVGGEIIAHKGIYVGQVGSGHLVPTVLTAGENYTFRQKLFLKEKTLKRMEGELAKLKCVFEALVPDQDPLSDHDKERHTEMEANISKFKADIQIVIDEVENIKEKSMNKSVKQIVVENTIYPKTTLHIGYETLEIKEEFVGPIEAKIVEDEIKLGKKGQ